MEHPKNPVIRMSPAQIEINRQANELEAHLRQMEEARRAASWPARISRVGWQVIHGLAESGFAHGFLPTGALAYKRVDGSNTSSSHQRHY